jgi:DNA-directed RNA polymerase subunit B'
MPYFEDIGAHPDILYNPHAFPTRETPNFIMEQAIDEVGTISDPFDPLPNLPKKPKFTSYKAYLPSGKECELFAGIIYFMRLKHLSSEKYHTRPPQYQGITGRYDPYDQVSKQPRAGKAQNGGMKIGEMERDAYVSSGKMQVSKYLMTDASDIQHYYVCSDPDCTYFIDAKKMGGLKGCPIEGCDGIMKRISIPYAIPLVCEHFRSIGNDLKFHLKQDTSNVIHEKN